MLFCAPRCSVLENYTGGVITATQPANIDHIVSLVRSTDSHRTVKATVPEQCTDMANGDQRTEEMHEDGWRSLLPDLPPRSCLCPVCPPVPLVLRSAGVRRTESSIGLDATPGGSTGSVRTLHWATGTI